MFWLAAIGLVVSAAASASAASSAKNTARAQGRVATMNSVTERHNAFVRRYYARMETMANQNILLSQAATYRNNARLIAQQRKVVERSTIENTRRVRQEGGRLVARQRATLAASGVAADRGTGRVIQTDTAVRIQQLVADQMFVTERDRRQMINAQREQLQRARAAQIQANVEGMRLGALDAGFDAETRRIGLQLQSSQIAVRGATAAANAQMWSSIGTAMVQGAAAWNTAGFTPSPS